MNTKTRTTGFAIAALTTALTLTACTSGPASWQDTVRADAKAYNSAQPASDLQDGCSALEMFGIESPEALADMVKSMSTDEDLWDDSGVDPAVIPEGKTDEAVLIVSEELFATCEGVETQTVEEMVNEEIDAEQSSLVDPVSNVPSADDMAVGVPVVVGDWTVTVTNIDKTVTNAEVKSWDEYNMPAEGQYIMVEYAATYNGTERTAGIYDLTWNYFTTDGSVYSESGVWNPYDNAGGSTEVRPGGTVEYATVFDVPKSDVATGTVAVEQWDESNFGTD